MTFVLVFLGLLIVACILLLVRNTMVYSFRTKLIERISTQVESDIYSLGAACSSWKWRWDEYDAVSYPEMVLKFWKRLSSFYPSDPARPVQ